MQLWMCLRNLTNSPMPAANHLLFFPSSGDMEHDWQMIGQHRKSDVQVESNQMTVSGRGGWTSCDVEDVTGGAFDRTEQSCNTEHNCQRERTNIKWCHFIFYRIELQTPLVLQTDHKTSRHTSITSGLLYVVSAQIMLSWASGSLVKVIVIWYFTYTTVVPLGVRVLISFFFFSFRFPGIRCPCLWNFFLRSALLTLPLNFEDPEAAVIFSESICLIRGSLMEADNLSPAPWTGLHVSSACYGKSFRGITELTEADSHCWWQAWF